MTDPDYNLPTPPAIRALAAMLLMVALWVAVFMAVLLLSAPARATSPHSEPIRERCDVIEVNTVYGETGSLVFVQFIFRDFEPWHSYHEIHAWRLQKNPAAFPVRDGDGWRLTFWDGEHLRSVWAKAAHWTAEIGDTEVWEREQFPVNYRRGLIEPKAKVFP